MNNKAGTDKWIAKTATEDVNYSAHLSKANGTEGCTHRGKLLPFIGRRIVQGTALIRCASTSTPSS